MEEEIKDYNEMSTQEIEDEVLNLQTRHNTQCEHLEKVEFYLSRHEKRIIDLKDMKKKAHRNMAQTKIDIKNLENIFKWRALRKERGY